LHALAVGVQGPPRAVLMLLLKLQEGTRRSNLDSVMSIGQLLSSTCYYLFGSGRVLYMGVRHTIPLLLVSLAVAFPEDAGGIQVTIDGMPAARFPRACVPLEWAGLVRMCGLRAYGEGDDVVVFPPYPLLSAFIQYKSDKNTCIDDTASFVTRVHALPVRLGKPGRGFAFRVAVALELYYESSPLMAAMFTIIEAGLPVTCRRMSLSGVACIDTEMSHVTPAKLVSLVLPCMNPRVVLVMGSDVNPAWDVVIPFSAEQGCTTRMLLFIKIGDPAHCTPDTHAENIRRLHEYVIEYRRVRTYGSVHALACYLRHNDNLKETGGMGPWTPSYTCSAGPFDRTIPPLGIPPIGEIWRWVPGCAPDTCVFVLDYNRETLARCAIRFDCLLPSHGGVHTQTACDDGYPAGPSFSTSWIAAIRPDTIERVRVW
jgi:hypothetical protein